MDFLPHLPASPHFPPLFQKWNTSNSSSVVNNESSYVNLFLFSGIGKGVDFLPHLPESLYFICTVTSLRL